MTAMSERAQVIESIEDEETTDRLPGQLQSSVQADEIENEEEAIETIEFEETDEDELRAVKTEAKGQFTNVRRGLLMRIARDEAISYDSIDMFSEQYQRVSAVMAELIGLYGSKKDRVSKTKIITELEILEEQFSAAMDKSLMYLDRMHSSDVHAGTQNEELRSSGVRSESQHGSTEDLPANPWEKPLTRSEPELVEVDQQENEGFPSGQDPLRTSPRLQSRLVSVPVAVPSQPMVSGAGVANHLASTSAGFMPVSTASSTSTGTSSSSRVVPASVSTSVHGASSSRAASSTVTSSNHSSTTIPLRAGAMPFSMTSSSTSGATKSMYGYKLPTQQFSPAVQPGFGIPSVQPSSGTAIHASQYQPPQRNYSGAYTSMPAGLTADPGRIAGPWAQLKKISIPVFDGDKRRFESWWAAFSSCIDAAPVTAESKMLQLRQYLKGQPLSVIESFGYSPAAYDAAKALLTRKYGGERRRVAIHLEEIEAMRPVRYGQPRELEHFADLLSIAVVNLKDSGRAAELAAGTFFYSLQRKLDQQIVARYHRWRYDHNQPESVESLLTFCTMEADFLVTAAETVSGFGPTARNDSPRAARDSRFEKPRTFAASTQPRQSTCAVCQGQHKVWQCMSFKAATPKKRWWLAKEHRLCYRCLEAGHSGQSCSWGRPCQISGCTKSHHRLLHGLEEKPVSKQQQVGTAPSEAEAKSAPTTLSTAQTTTPAVSMRTVPVVLKHNSQELHVNALLDDASTDTYVTSRVADQLGLTGEQQTLSVKVLSGRTEMFRTTAVTVEIHSIDGTTSATLDAFTTDSVIGTSSAVNWQQQQHKWPHLVEIPFAAMQKRRQVDILIGINGAELQTALKEVRGQPGEPIARLTPLGWTCIGFTSQHQRTRPQPMTYLIQTASSDINESLAQLWSIEEFSKDEPQLPLLSAEEQDAMRATRSSMRQIDDRYEVGIPWRDGRPTLPDNYPAAVKRLRSTEKRLSQDSAVAAAYNKIIKDYVSKGYVRKVAATELKPGRQWFLPHFAVLRPDKETTKTRIVFDASAKYDGIALNDTIFPGPKLQRQLPSVLTRFRQRPVAVVCDIAEMYLRIGLHPEDRPYHRFLWRDLDQSTEPQVYEFQRLVFGANASPFLAQFVSQEHARSHQTDYPLAAETMLSSTYMDDSMDSAADNADGVKLYEQLSRCWKGAGMHARKWLSNSKVVMERVPKEDRASQIDLDCPELPSVKTLGLLWSATTDNFTFKPRVSRESRITKRSFLSATASVFDPLGFITPYTVQARILIQDMWIDGCDWDDPLPETVNSKVVNWYSDLAELSDLKIPRCLQEVATNSPVNRQIHVFADASEVAYGAVAYLRCVYHDGHVSTALISSRARVAPIAAVSIPRMELMAAVLAVQLAIWAADVLSEPKNEVALWTDSLNVLYWIRNRARSFKPFIASRVGEIQRHTTPRQWRHVPTKQNPADILSRGATARTLIHNTLWWSAPEFLQKAEEEWPVRNLDEPKSVTLLEQKKNSPDVATPKAAASCSLVTLANNEPSWRLKPERFSSFTRLVRQRALVVRFLHNCQKPPELREVGPLSADELGHSRAGVIAKAQEEAFDEYRLLKSGKQIPVTSKLAKLRPMLNNEQLLCMDGRLRNAEILQDDTRCPVILPRGHWVTQLIVKDAHEECHHAAGVSHTLALLSQRYWLIAGREEIKAWEKKCAHCHRLSAKPGSQIMAPLPTVRVTLPLRAFSRVAVDFGGPFMTKQGRGRPRLKRYLCLFTCLQSRAVHLEVATSLDVSGFMNAFVRMTNRRGTPLQVVSDNGTNFVGAAREMEELVRAMDKDVVVRQAADRGIQWSFNPPAAPHFGGVHEALIKSAKRAIYAILAPAEVNDEELITAVTAAEALLNSRPLSYQSADARDLLPLTPNHFLYGQQGRPFVPKGTDTAAGNIHQRWRVIQNLVLAVWKRWMVEILPLLNPRAKWRQEQPDLKVDDVVLLVDKNTPRGQWRLGRVQETFPGRDGHVRVVSVKVGTTSLTRPITQLCRIGPD